MVNLLIRKGANVNAKIRSNSNPLDRVVEGDDELKMIGVADLLMSHGAEFMNMGMVLIKAVY